MNGKYCIMGVVLMESSDSYDSGCFDNGMKPIEYDEINKATYQLMNSPLATLIRLPDIKIFAGTHFH
jgi:hypothetical protein